MSKVRTGFVSNSSSSSFIVLKSNMTDEQIHQMRNIAETAKEMMKRNDAIRYSYNSIDPSYFDWMIVESEEDFRGSTLMDNFSMDTFLDMIGVEIYEVEQD